MNHLRKILLLAPLFLCGCGTELTGQVLAVHILTHDDAVAGEDGEDGINCWDTNRDRIDDPEEDVNDDGEWDTKDCQGLDGTNGTNGVDGTNGTNGTDGVDAEGGDGEHHPPGNPSQPTGPGNGHGGAV